MHPLSAEQLAVVADVCEGRHHVYVDAVAGSGKTTTILGVAAALPTDSRVLLLTYNAKLKFDTRTRVAAQALSERLHVHSYHSAALNIYGDSACCRDEGITALLSTASRRVVTSSTPRYDVLVVDEVQDMTPLYFRLVGALLWDVCAPEVRLLVLGDRRQAIYQFKGSDARFLTLAPDVFGSLPALQRQRTPNRWTERTLSTTYRLTPPCARFVNMQILAADTDGSTTLPDGGPAMRTLAHGTATNMTGCWPRYLLCNAFGGGPFAEVQRWLRMGVQPGEIFVLAASTRNNALVRQLENRLVRKGVLCYATTSDEGGSEVQDERVTRGKVVFATFHQAKGLERRAVMVFGFDAAYTTYHDRQGVQEAPGAQGIQARARAPNPIYVAATRAKQHLVLVHHSDNKPLSTIRPDRLLCDCDVIVPAGEQAGISRKGCGDFWSATMASSSALVDGLGPRSMTSVRATACHPGTRRVAVTDVLRFLPDAVLARAVSMLTFLETPSPNASTTPTQCLPALVASVDGETAESVAAITGIALPAIFEADLFRGTATAILRHSALHSASLPPAHRSRIDALSRPYQRRRLSSTSSKARAGASVAGSVPGLSVSDHLYVANVYHALTSGFRCKLQQVKAYDWLDEATVRAAMDTFHRHVSAAAAVLASSVATTDDGEASAVAAADVCAFEVPLCYEDSDALTGLTRSLVGVADMIDMTDMTLWEFKCTGGGGDGREAFDAEHKLQLAMYAYMWTRTHGRTEVNSPRRFKLLNILSGDVSELLYDDDAVRGCIESLLAARTWRSGDATGFGTKDDDFVRDAASSALVFGVETSVPSAASMVSSSFPSFGFVEDGG